jgi:hypothetical protein
VACFDFPQQWLLQIGFICAMPAVTFQCPITRQHVSGFEADEPDDSEDRLAAVECIACRRVHAINPKTRKVFGSDD